MSRISVQSSVCSSVFNESKKIVSYNPLKYSKYPLCQCLRRKSKCLRRKMKARIMPMQSMQALHTWRWHDINLLVFKYFRPLSFTLTFYILVLFLFFQSWYCCWFLLAFYLWTSIFNYTDTHGLHSTLSTWKKIIIIVINNIKVNKLH